MGSLLVFSLLAGTAPLVASIIPFMIFKNGINPRSFQILLGLSAGLLFSIATLELIPEAVTMAQITVEDSITQKGSMDKRSLLATLYSSKYTQAELTPAALDGEETESDSIHIDHHHDEEKEDSSVRTAMMGIGAGFMFLILVEEVMSLYGLAHSHSHGGSKDESDDEEEHAGHSHNKQPGLRSSMSAVAFVGLAFHSLVDGMIIAGAFTASPEVGSRVAIAILLHKFPDGFVMSSIVASQQSKFQNFHPFTYVVLIAAMTPLGAVIGAMLMGSFTPVAVAFILGMQLQAPPIAAIVLSIYLGFGAGTFLFITAAGILPELLQSKGPDKIISLSCILVGYLGFLLIDTTIHAH